MGRPEYLIDSNVIIDYLSGKLPLAGTQLLNTVIDEIPNISVITKIEILGYKAPKKADQLLKEFVSDSNIYGLTDQVVDRCIELRKAFKIKLPDAIIAATAISNDLKLITRNTNDFKNITGIELLNPHLLIQE